LKWIGFTVSEKVNPGEPGGTKPRVRLTGAGFGQHVTLAEVISRERTAGLPKKQSCWLKKLLFTCTETAGLFENTACCLFLGAGFFYDACE
jgi:hypothetical protein